MLSELSTVLLSALPLALPTPGVNVTGVSLHAIAHGGSGCPQGSLRFIWPITSDRIIGIFDGYSAAIGPGVNVTANRRNCQINLDINYPAGIQYTLANNTYSGYANLDSGVLGSHQSTYYFSGNSLQISSSESFTGPMNQKFTATEVAKTASNVWSPCGTPQPMNINNVLKLNLAGGAPAGASGTLYDAGILDIMLEWRDCTP